MVDYSLSISKYIVFVGLINLALLFIIYIYNKKENNKMYLGLAIIYTVIQVAYRYFLYIFNSYGLIGVISKVSFAHLYYNNLIVMLISLILCYITIFYILKLSSKYQGNINYIALILIAIGLYTGVL